MIIHHVILILIPKKNIHGTSYRILPNMNEYPVSMSLYWRCYDMSQFLHIYKIADLIERLSNGKCTWVNRSHLIHSTWGVIKYSCESDLTMLLLKL